MKRDLNKYTEVRILRGHGNSIKTIAKTLNISSSTASIWCRDVELSKQQKLLLGSRGKSADLLRSFALKRHEDKIKRHQDIFDNSQAQIDKLTNQELFLTGIALYWAEGFKSASEQTVGFCNSDPRIIIFILDWFRNSLQIPKEDFILRAEFNIDHLQRKEEIEDYWSNLTGIPKTQFNKPFLQRAKQRRDYSKRGVYYGVLRIRIRKSSELLVKLKGWMMGLSQAI